jgi:4'-phosphopantetheinyl transferase
MPLVHHLELKNGEIMHWEVTESLEELIQSSFKWKVSTDVPDFIEARQKQILVMRILHRMVAPGTTIDYEPTGKPVLMEGGHISFSHSRNHVVVYRTDAACGVDLEQLNERILKIRRKFINNEEQEYLNSEDVDMLIRLWSAKEAMFKVYGKDGVYLRSNIFVSDLSRDGCLAQLRDGAFVINRKINFRSIHDMILAWTETETYGESE